MTKPVDKPITPQMVHAFFETKRAENDPEYAAGPPPTFRGQSEEQYFARIAGIMNAPPVYRHADLAPSATKPAGPSGTDLIGDAKPAQGRVEKWVDDTVGDPHRKVTKALAEDRSTGDVKDAAKGLKDAAKQAYSGKPKDTQSLFLSLAKMAVAVYLSSFTTNDKLAKLEGWTLGCVAGALSEDPPRSAERRSRHGSADAFDAGVQEGLAAGQQHEHQEKIRQAVQQHGRGAALKAIWLQVLDNAKFADGDSPNTLAEARGWTW